MPSLLVVGRVVEESGSNLKGEWPAGLARPNDPRFLMYMTVRTGMFIRPSGSTLKKWKIMTVCLCVPVHIVNSHTFDRVILIGNFDRISLIYYIDRMILMRNFVKGIFDMLMERNALGASGTTQYS